MRMRTDYSRAPGLTLEHAQHYFNKTMNGALYRETCYHSDLGHQIRFAGAALAIQLEHDYTSVLIQSAPDPQEPLAR